MPYFLQAFYFHWDLTEASDVQHSDRILDFRSERAILSDIAVIWLVSTPVLLD